MTASIDADLLVVGAGVAGLAAVLEASRRGVAVLIIEAAETYGGASSLSGGGCSLVGTPPQDACGISDNVELALADWRATAGSIGDEAWARRYFQASRADVYDWVEDLGVTWLQRPFPQPGNSAARWHAPAGGGGAIVASLVRALDTERVRWKLGARVRRLSIDGVLAHTVVEDAEGRTSENISTRGVVVATGGFVSSREMLSNHGALFGDPGVVLSGGAVTARGDGHRILAECGADFVNLDRIWVYPVGTPNYRAPNGTRGLMVRNIRNEIWVNRDGRRFHDETDRGFTGGLALLEQPRAVSWGIFDDTEAQSLTLAGDSYFGTSDETAPSRRREFFDTSPYVWRADNLETLSDRAGIHPNLVETVAGFNVLIEQSASRDPLTGRVLAGARRIANPPFTAIRYQPLAEKNLGGVRTDARCRVIGDGRVLSPSLYAAGEVAGMSGGCINGELGLEGMMFGPCLFSGRVAGGEVASYLADSEAQCV